MLNYRSFSRPEISNHNQKNRCHSIGTLSLLLYYTYYYITDVILHIKQYITEKRLWFPITMVIDIYNSGYRKL